MKLSAKKPTPKASPKAKKAKNVTPKVDKVAKSPKVAPKKTPSKKNDAKTPTADKKVKKTPKKTPNKGHLVFDHSSEEGFDKDNVLTFVKALKKVVAEQAKNDKNLFDDEENRINLQITGIKLPSDHRSQMINITLPNDYLCDPHDVCLFVKDLEKGIRPDHEKTLEHFNEVLQASGVQCVTQVIALRELKVEYKTFETKTALCHKFDKFICDDRILRLIPKFLGKPFYKRKKFPVAVDMNARNLRKAFDRAMHTVTLALSHHGACSMVQAGNLDMEDEAIAENIVAIGKALQRRYPGGWKNIRSIHLKAEKSMALPIYTSILSGNELGKVDSDVPSKIKQSTVEDELSTQPGMTVRVRPGGKVTVTKASDPGWDADKDEPFVEGSEDEEETEKENVEEKKAKKKATKRKAEAKNKKAVNSDEEEEDSDLEEAELKYMKKVAEEEEEMEAKEEAEVKSSKGKKGKKAAKKEESEDEQEEDEDEEESDGDEEAEDEEVSGEEGEDEEGSDDEDEDDDQEYDDDKELDEEDVLVDDDDDDENEEESDDE